MRMRLTRLAALMGVAALALATYGCSGSVDEDSADSSASTSAAGSPESALSLVVIGDSIPYNSSADCPGCTGFVERYADALAEATGRKVETSNLSQHNGLTLPMLMDRVGAPSRSR